MLLHLTAAKNVQALQLIRKWQSSVSILLTNTKMKIKKAWQFIFLISWMFSILTMSCRRALQMNMLLRLQEAANYSSTQSCDSDSTSHHDEQLDSSLESALWGRRMLGRPFNLQPAEGSASSHRARMCRNEKLHLPKWNTYHLICSFYLLFWHDKCAIWIQSIVWSKQQFAS